MWETPRVKILKFQNVWQIIKQKEKIRELKKIKQVIKFQRLKVSFYTKISENGHSLSYGNKNEG